MESSMNDTLKAAGRIGAELGAAKAEIERLRGLLQQVVDCQAEHYGDGCGLHLSMITLAGRIKDALSQQAEPVEPDCDRSACGDFSPGPCDNPGCSARRDKPAPAKDEREAKAWPALAGIGRDSGHPRAVVLYLRHEPSDEHLRMIQEALRTRPAQTEQQPLIFINPMVVDELEGRRKPSPGGLTWSRKACAHWTFPLYAAPVAQTEQQPVATWMGTDWNAQQQLIAHLCKLEPGTDLYAAPVAQTAPQPEQSEELAWKVLQAATDALDRRAAPHAWISQAWNAGSEVITSRRAAKPTQGASEQ
jgi:hypothetical protein